MTKTFKSRLLGVLISSLVLLTGFLGVSLGLGDNAQIAHADTACTYENGFCTTHNSDSECYYEACTQNSDGYYEIANAGNLFWFAKQVNADNDYYYGRMKGKIVVDEINLEDRLWTPIGSGYPFHSQFDGNNAIVSGLNLTATGDYNGLFGNVGSCVIKDLTVKGKINISATDSTAVNYVGGVIGWGDGGTTLDNVTSYVEIIDTNSSISSAVKQQKIGGVAGYIQSGMIKNCNYNGTMTMLMAKHGAGIVGYASSSTIDHCNNYGTVTFKGESYHIGGIVGHMESNTNVKCCANYGNVTSGGNDCIGGVVGYILKGTIENCSNIGNINCTYEEGGFVGGILGYVNYDNITSLKNCFNYGTISSTEGTSKHIGAIIGYAISLTVSKTDNNYYLDTSCDVPSDTTTINAEPMNADQFECGKVAYLLNGKKTNGTQVWYQTLGNDGDDYPVFSGETVYYTRIGGCTKETYVYGYRNKEVNATTHGYGTGINYAETDSDDKWEFNVYCNDCGTCVKHIEIQKKQTLYYDGVAKPKLEYCSITYCDDMPEYNDYFENKIVGFCFFDQVWLLYTAPGETNHTIIRDDDLSVFKEIGTYGYRFWAQNWEFRFINSHTLDVEYSEDVLYTKYSYSEVNFNNLEDDAYNYRKELYVYDVVQLLPSTLNVTFEDYDGSEISKITVDGSNPEDLVVPTYTIPSNDYYTFTFKHWYCEQTGENYTSENLPSYEDLFDKGYTDVTFKAVYDIKYKKSFELVGSIDKKTGLSDSVIYTNGENVKIVDSGDVNVYANYKIATNDGVAALLLIPKYDSKFTISAVSVNGTCVYGSGATSNDVLSGWTATVTGSETDWDTFKIVLEQLPASNATGDMFIQIVYTMSEDDVETGEYNFGFVTNYYSDTADATTNENLTHNDRSEAYGVLSNSEIASLCEVKISVTDANIILVKRQDAEAELVNNNVVYDANNVDIFEDCYYKANELEEQIKNELVYHYSAYGTTLVNGDSWNWLQYVHFNWYDKNGNALEGAPINVGQYKVGISAEQNDYFNAIEETKFDFVITPYTIDIEVAQPADKTYNANAQTWVNDTFNITYVDGKAAFGSDEGYTYTVADNTKDSTTGNYYNKNGVERNWAGTYTVTLTFTATANYTFKEQTVSGASIAISDDGTTKTVTFDVEIKKYEATVSAANKTSQYSDNIVELSMGNLIDVDGVLVKDLPGQGNFLKLLYTTTATKTSNVGKYPITISVDPNSSAIGSYEFTFIHEMKGADTNGNNGTYTITHKLIDLPTIDDLTYNGLEQFPVLTDAATVNEKVAYSFSGNAQINVGNYTLTATLANANYKWNSETISDLATTLDWKIIPVVLTVTIGDYSTQYGEDLAEIIPTIDPVNGLQNGETLESIGVTYIIGSGFDTEKDANDKLPVGTYVITANYGGTNYAITFENGEYKVTKRILDEDGLTRLIVQIVGATKEYTGSELTWVYNADTKDFTIIGELNGIAYSDIISITAVAAKDGDYTNANGKLDGDSWTYWDPETKLYYTVSIKVNDADSYMLYTDESGNAVTESDVDVEVFIKQATNGWTTTPYVNAEDIDSYEHGADAKFKGEGEVSIVIKDSEGNEVAPENLVKGTNYTVYFTVVETNNYTGLSKESTFELAGYSVVTLPTVYLDEENGTIVTPNGNVKITYDGLTHKFVVVPDGEGKYTITINTGDYSTWKNANGVYYITIAVTENYQWGDDDRADKTYTLNIDKAALTVTANTYNVSFGDTIAKYETTASGFVNGEVYATYGSIDVDSYLTCSYVAGDQVLGKVGTHDITFGAACQSALDTLLTNYNVTLVDGAVNVTAMQLELDLSKLQGKLDSEAWELWTNLVANGGYTLEYNAKNHTFYLKESSYPTQLVPTITYQYGEGEFGTDLPCNAGIYQIKVVFNVKEGLDADNYYWTDPENTVSVTITKVGITVTTNGQTVIYTGNNVALNTTEASEAALSLTNGRDITATTFDFIRNSATGVVVGYVKLNGDYSAVGTYTSAITADLTYDTTNYTIDFVDGTLIIEKDNLTWEITLKTENRDYNGSAIKEGIDDTDETKAKDYYAWLNESADRQYLTYKFYTKEGESYMESSVPSNAGTYYVKAFYDDTIANAINTDYVEIVIGKATIVISGIDNITKNYLQDYTVAPTATKPVLDTDDGYTPNVKVEYYKDGTLVSDEMLRNGKPYTVGTYTIKVTIENANDNYQSEVVEKTLTINQATLNGVTFEYDLDTATWEAITQTTDGEDINKYGNVTVTYKVGETTITDNKFTAESIGTFTLIASIEGNENFIASESTMVEVFSVEFADKKANHAKTETEYDFSKVAPKQYRFSGQKATQPDCCNEGAAEITIAGYTFKKQWKLGEDIYGFTAQVSESITLYAVWDINKYTVTWMNDDNALATEEYEYLDEPSYKGDTPTRDTTDEWVYTFGGWSLAIDGEKIELSAVTDNITYYAFYTKDGVTYKIIFMVSEDGGEYKTYETMESAKFGATLTDLYNLANVTWFRGDVWYQDEARTQVITTMPVAKGGITVYGAYVFDIGNGDVNADGKITTDDITIYREWVVGGYEMTIVESGTEWTLVHSADFNASNKYYLLRVADVNADTSDDIRDITTVRMAIVDGYGYKIYSGVESAQVTGQAVCTHRHSSNGVYAHDAEYHWLVCEVCGDIYNKTRHIAYGDDVSCGETYHSFTCEYCSEPVNEEHIDEDGNGYCDVCGDCLLFEVKLSSDGTYSLEKYIGDTNVTELTVPSTVHGKRVGNGTVSYLLKDCTSLETITCWIPYWGFSDFFGHQTNGYTLVPETLKRIIISEGVTEIGREAFCYLKNVESIEIPDSVTSIGERAFCYCSSLKTLKIPSGVTSIGKGAFECCKSLQSMVIPDGVTTLQESLFANDEVLESIVLPKSVTSIEDSVFYYCRVIRKIYYTGTAEEYALIDIHSGDNTNNWWMTLYATIYYYSEIKPTDTENTYWYYNESGEPTIWTVE